jgi:hypothetical protein
MTRVVLGRRQVVVVDRRGELVGICGKLFTALTAPTAELRRARRNSAGATNGAGHGGAAQGTTNVAEHGNVAGHDELRRTPGATGARPEQRAVSAGARRT